MRANAAGMRTLVASLLVAATAIACGSTVTTPGGTSTSSSTSTSTSSSTSSSSSSSGDGCKESPDGGNVTTYPETSTTAGCPTDTPPIDACTVGQTCTWTTGAGSATYECQSVTDCADFTSNVWVAGTMKGDGCSGATCCIPCNEAKPGEPCAVLGFQCAYVDNSTFPPLMGLVCREHAWVGVPVCEN